MFRARQKAAVGNVCVMPVSLAPSLVHACMELCDRSFFHPAANYAKAVTRFNRIADGVAAIPSGAAYRYISKSLSSSQPTADLQVLVYRGTAQDRFNSARQLRTLFVGIEGSVTKHDWTEDFRFHLTEQPDELKGARVHRGFLNEWNALAPSVREAIDPLIRAGEVDAILFVGHSSGAAVAQLAATNFNVALSQGVYEGFSENNVHVGTINYAGPRVGGDEWVKVAARYLPDNLRVTQRSDIIPMLPARMQGYRHVGQEVVINTSPHGIGRRTLTACETDHSSLQNGNARELILVYQILLPIVLSVVALLFLCAAAWRSVQAWQPGPEGGLPRLLWMNRILEHTTKSSRRVILPY